MFVFIYLFVFVFINVRDCNPSRCASQNSNRIGNQGIFVGLGVASSLPCPNLSFLHALLALLLQMVPAGTPERVLVEKQTLQAVLTPNKCVQLPGCQQGAGTPLCLEMWLPRVVVFFSFPWIFEFKLFLMGSVGFLQ